MPRDLGSKRHFAGILHSAVLSHKEASAAGHALQDAKQAASAAHLRVRRHLNGPCHPREFAAFRENALVGVKLYVEYGHGSALNPGLHADLLSRTVYPVIYARQGMSVPWGVTSKTTSL